MTPHHDVVIVGSGFSGLGMAIKLKQEGLDDFVVLERGDSLGGTWRDNHYPGCACDVPAPLYSFSFAPNPEWTRLYAPYNEIRDYLEDCADRFGVREHIRFGANVTGGEWDEERQLWHIEVDGERAYTARVAVGGIGGLNHPSLPEIEGRDSFAGPAFHTAEWDHDVDLTGKRVAVIGTGASAIQVVPQIVEKVGRLELFQRTPPWVLPKPDHRFTRLDRWLFRKFPITQRVVRSVIFGITETIGFQIIKQPPFVNRLADAGRANIRRAIKDPELRRKLTPDYEVGCKRLLVANNYYPALARPNVDVVTEGIERITEKGIVTADGVEHEVDVIVYGTGFEIRKVMTSLDLRGRGGASLRERFEREGIKAHRGTFVHGFPNLMLLSGPNTGTGSTSQVFMIEAQLHHAMEALRLMRRRAIATVDVRPEVQEAYNAELRRRMAKSVWLTGGCQSWYLDETGHSPVLYPNFSTQFWRSLRRFREDEYELEPARRPATEPERDEPATAPVAA